MRKAVASTDDIELPRLATGIMFELSWRDKMRRLEIKFKGCTAQKQKASENQAIW